MIIMLQYCFFSLRVTFSMRVREIMYLRYIYIQFISSPGAASIVRPSIHPSTFHILNFSRTAEGIYSKLATNVPYEVLTKCCYFLSRSKTNIAALDSDWLTHFQLLLRNCLKDLFQICHKYSL